MDGGASRKPVRVQVGWDSNDYQIDVGTEYGRAVYKRMFDRDASLGITHAIYAPQNSKRSAINASSDVWGWEESLCVSTGCRGCVERLATVAQLWSNQPRPVESRLWLNPEHGTTQVDRTRAGNPGAKMAPGA
eukprot:SAG11_NODE_128_length_15542_cov_6.432105_7_plen_133_part_00